MHVVDCLSEDPVFGGGEEGEGWEECFWCGGGGHDGSGVGGVVTGCERRRICVCKCDVVRYFAGWGSWELLTDGASWSGNLGEELRCISGDN